MAQLFREGCPKIMADIRSAVDTRDPWGLEHHAYDLKGSSGNLGAAAVSDAAAALEDCARCGNLERADALLKSLEVSLSHFLPELESLSRTIAGGGPDAAG